MNLDDFKPIPVSRMGGQVDYQGPTKVINGCAVKAQNMRYLPDKAATRFGHQVTISKALGDAAGVDCLTVEGNLNPRQVPVVFDSTGALSMESPVGSGILVPLTPPFPLPTGAQMATSKANNNLYQAFRRGVVGACPPLVYNGPGATLSPLSQNPIGAIWAPGRYAIPGDVVRTSQNSNRWFLCVGAGLMGSVEPTWPTLDGYFIEVAFVNSFTAAQIQDPNGPSLWTEWTPFAGQYVPQPEAPAQILSILGQAGAPVGSIPAAQDVYVAFAYINSNGESIWTIPVVYVNTALNDCLEVFFQSNGDKPGPTVPATYNAAGYGGPRLPQWLASVVGVVDQSIAWPGVSVTQAGFGGGVGLLRHRIFTKGTPMLNVYAAAVPTGSSAPFGGYYQIATGAPMTGPVVISAIPTTGTLYQARLTPTSALTSIPFTGVSGPRYFAVGRQDVNDSLVPIDPASPLLVNFQSSLAETGTANVTFIQRSSNVVTCTVDLLAGFTQGADVILSGVDDSSFDGTFALTGVAPNEFGGATLIWQQTGNDAASTGGTAESASAASAFVVQQSLIATISRSGSVVSAIVNTLSGLTTGAAISVSGVLDPGFDGSPFVITSIVAANGGGGTVTWAQSGTGTSSTGGIIAPTGAGVGTNVPQPLGLIARGEAYVPDGTVIAKFIGDSAPPSPPPGFVVGATIVIAGVSLADLNGVFTLTEVGSESLFQGQPGWHCTWAQPGSEEHVYGSGTLTLVSGATVQQSQGNVEAIARTANVVTATVDNVAGFVAGSNVQVNGVLDSSYDGTFTLTAVNPTLHTLTWSQAGGNSSSSGGVVAQSGGGQQQPAPVAVLPPGGAFISLDIAVFSVQGAPQAGPLFEIPEQDPLVGFSATIVQIGAVNGAVTALLSDTSGLVAGDVIAISGSENGWFDGVFVLAQVSGNTIEYAGVGPGTGYAGGTLSLVPTQPTEALGQLNPLPIGAISRNASGVVTANLANVANLNIGLRIQVSAVTDSTFDGRFTLSGVNQFPASEAGTVTWQDIISTVGASTGGAIAGVPGILVNFDDTFLSASDDLTDRLTALGVPPACSDMYFVESLGKMTYIDNQSYPSAVLFSDDGDPANITGDSGDPQNPGSGILSINTNDGGMTICVREIKDGPILALKSNGGYQLSPSANYPSLWTPIKRWDTFGPGSPALVAVGTNFVVFAAASGAYAYLMGQSELEWISEELSSSDGSWKRVNWAAAILVGWSVVDEVNREIHFGLPVDGSTTVNAKFTMSYFTGWGKPEVLNRYGKLIASRESRRWSIDPFVATCASVVNRTIASSDPRIQTRQLLFGLPASNLSAVPGTTLNILRAKRVAGIVTLTLSAATDAAMTASVLVNGVQDPSFNGVFTGAVFSAVAPYTCIYPQVGIQRFSGGGTVAIGENELQIMMQVPDHYDDCGNGIDSQYGTWLAQSDPYLLRLGGFRGGFQGNGAMSVQPVTDDPAAIYASVDVQLSGGKTKHVGRGLRVPDNEHIGLVLTNKNTPGSWFSIEYLEMCANPIMARKG